MDMPKVNLDVLRTVPLGQKIMLLGIVIAGIGVGFYYYVVEPKENSIATLQADIVRLDTEIQGLSIKVKHLEELEAANKQLELELARKKERLPPEEEAVMLLKQLSDMGIKLGLDIKSWQPSAPITHSTGLYRRIPVKVEVAGGYHTAALFFDRINKLQRIVNVSNLQMGNPRIEENNRVVIQSVFELSAFVAPPDVKPAGK